MSLITDLVNKANAIITWQPGSPGFGETLLGYYTSVRDTIVSLWELVLTKAPGDHTHEGAGGTPILSRGGEVDRLSDGVTFHLRSDDPGRAEVIEDGGLVGILDSTPPLARQDHATRVALRPNAGWESAVAGATGTLKLVQLLVTNLDASADKSGQLSADGGSTAHVDFVVPAGAGTYSLGAFVVDHDDVDLAVKGVADANLAFRAVVMTAPPGVGRLSGVSAGSLFVAAPIYSGALATLHTASGAQSVVLYAARATGNAGTKWLALYGATTAGADTQLGRWSMDEDSPPIALGQFALKAGDALKLGAEAASEFVVYGYAVIEE